MFILLTVLTAVSPCQRALTNRQIVNKCVYLSDAVYTKGHRSMKTILENNGFNNLEIIENDHNNRAIVYFEKNKAFVSFRGTAYPQNLAQDFNSRLLSDEIYGRTGKVHTGFHTIWKSLENDVVKLCKNKHVIFTGHSMAGSVAQIASCYLPDTSVITFGSSRTGNDAFANTVRRKNGMLYMFRNVGDSVTSLPLAAMGYADTTTDIISIDADGNLADLQLDEVPMVNDARVIHLLSQGKLSINEILKKHHMEEYKNRLLD